MFRPVLTCPTYHHIAAAVSSPVAHLGVWTATADFEAHLDHFEANYDIVDLETLLTRRWPRRPLLLTFDDSLRSIATTVAPILKRRGLPGVVFLNPDMIERPVLQFDHALSELAERVGLVRVLAELGPDAVAGSDISAYLNGPALTLTVRERQAAQARLLAAFDLEEAHLYAELDFYLRPQDLPLLREAGLEIANHTASHARCRALGPEDQIAEITESKRRLEALARRPIRAFSVPYGSRHDATADVLSTVAASGHDVVFLTDGRLSGNAPPAIASHPMVWDRIPFDGFGADRMKMQLKVKPRLRGMKDQVRRLVRVA
jgi:peptidoglycan/xylan/chitin deacetylase (PgdA/CDA1 family)